MNSPYSGVAHQATHVLNIVLKNQNDKKQALDKSLLSALIQSANTDALSLTQGKHSSGCE
ncbi:MAG: hypothetical protein ACK5MF_07880 [Vibrio sp.]|uniref:hypothetical protein n=1 Tax=Vibrio sp. TaxID=678 RepID=UPI003A83EDE4